jgi:hypothetical protein
MLFELFIKPRTKGAYARKLLSVPPGKEYITSGCKDCWNGRSGRRTIFDFQKLLLVPIGDLRK